MKNTQDLIAQAHATNQQQLRIPSQDVLSAQIKKCGKLRMKKEGAERIAVKKIESLLAKPVSPEKPLNRPQYIAVRTLGFITHPIAEPFSGMAIVLPCFLLTDNFFTGLGLSVVATASVAMLSKRFLPRLASRAQAVNDIIPVLDNLSTSNNPDIQKYVGQLADKLNDPNMPSTFWSKCYDCLILAAQATNNYNRQQKVVDTYSHQFDTIEVETTSPGVSEVELKRMKL